MEAVDGYKSGQTICPACVSGVCVFYTTYRRANSLTFAILPCLLFNKKLTLAFWFNRHSLVARIKKPLINSGSFDSYLTQKRLTL